MAGPHIMENEESVIAMFAPYNRHLASFEYNNLRNCFATLTALIAALVSEQENLLMRLQKIVQILVCYLNAEERDGKN